MRALVSQEEVGDTAVYLGSDLSAKVTGETIHIDAGYHILGMTISDEELGLAND
jgi:enoyl-[acyl-carrier protein] reductase I